MDVPTLIAQLDFARARLLATLGAIEKSGQDTKQVLGWRPGPGRAHIGWQLMHCAATHDRYLNAQLLGGKPKDESLVANFAGGSTPADSNVAEIDTIRTTLEKTFSDFKNYVSTLKPVDLDRKVGPPGKERAVGEAIVLLAWHEGHHQGQIHLTWNLYKAAHGISG